MAFGYANDTSIRIVGMSRSGNHAIIDWLLRAIAGRDWCFLNCVEPKADPWSTARPMDDGRCWRTGAANARDVAGAARRAKAPQWDVLLRSYEDTFLTPVFGIDHAWPNWAAIGGSRRCVDVLILRDPYNLFASRRRSRTGLVGEKVAIRIWKQHARAFLARRHARTPLVTISYNTWVKDRGYRRRKAAALGLAAPADDIGRVAGCNGGSSFDGYAFADRPEQMRVLDRWRHYADDPSFAALFDDTVRRLADDIFGHRFAAFRSLPSPLSPAAPSPA